VSEKDEPFALPLIYHLSYVFPPLYNTGHLINYF